MRFLAFVILVVAAVICSTNAQGKYTRTRRRLYGLCPPGFQQIDIECYYISKTEASWLDAHFECKDKNSRLAEPYKNADRNLRKYLVTRDRDRTDLWIGGTYNWKESKWQWGHDGKEMKYHSFGQAERRRDDLEHHCAAMDPSKKYRWSAELCAERHRFICQHRMPKVSEKNRARVYNRWNTTYPNQMANEVVLEVTDSWYNGTRKRNYITLHVPYQEAVFNVKVTTHRKIRPILSNEVEVSHGPPSIRINRRPSQSGYDQQADSPHGGMPPRVNTPSEHRRVPPSHPNETQETDFDRRAEFQRRRELERKEMRRQQRRLKLEREREERARQEAERQRQLEEMDKYEQLRREEERRREEEERRRQEDDRNNEIRNRQKDEEEERERQRQEEWRREEERRKIQEEEDKYEKLREQERRRIKEEKDKYEKLRREEERRRQQQEDEYKQEQLRREEERRRQEEEDFRKDQLRQEEENRRKEEERRRNELMNQEDERRRKQEEHERNEQKRREDELRKQEEANSERDQPTEEEQDKYERLRKEEAQRWKNEQRRLRALKQRENNERRRLEDSRSQNEEEQARRELNEGSKFERLRQDPRQPLPSQGYVANPTEHTFENSEPYHRERRRYDEERQDHRIQLQQEAFQTENERRSENENPDNAGGVYESEKARLEHDLLRRKEIERKREEERQRHEDIMRREQEERDRLEREMREQEDSDRRSLEAEERRRRTEEEQRQLEEQQKRKQRAERRARGEQKRRQLQRQREEEAERKARETQQDAEKRRQEKIRERIQNLSPEKRELFYKEREKKQKRRWQRDSNSLE